MKTLKERPILIGTYFVIDRFNWKTLNGFISLASGHGK